jgi:hypothetical protein
MKAENRITEIKDGITESASTLQEKVISSLQSAKIPDIMVTKNERSAQNALQRRSVRETSNAGPEQATVAGGTENAGTVSPQSGGRNAAVAGEESGSAEQTTLETVDGSREGNTAAASTENRPPAMGGGHVQPAAVTWGAEPTEAANASIQRHADIVTKARGKTPTVRVVNQLAPEIAKQLQQIKSVAGIKSPDVFAYESDDDFGNAWIDDTGIFVRVNSKRGPSFDYAHEVGHDDSAIVAAGKRYIENKLPKSELEAYKRYRDTHIASPDKADIISELIADMFGRYLYQTATGKPAAEDFGLSQRTLDAFEEQFENAIGAQEGTEEGELVDIVTPYIRKGDPEYSRVQGDQMQESVSYDALIGQPDMTVISMPDAPNREGIRGTAIKAGMENARSKNNPLNTDGQTFVRNKYSGTDIQVMPSSIRHGMVGNETRITNNARLGAVIGDAIENAITINELEPREGAERTFLMAGVAEGKGGPFLYAIVTNQTTRTQYKVEKYGSLPDMLTST